MGKDDERLGIAEGGLLAEDPIWSNKVATRTLLQHHRKTVRENNKRIKYLETKLKHLEKFERLFGDVTVTRNGFKSRESLLTEYLKLRSLFEYVTSKMRFYRHAWKNQINTEDKYE